MAQLSLSSLKISYFRTHKLSIIEPENKPIVIFGVNGTGKTNILESISMFAPGQGFKRAKFSELARKPDLFGWKLTGEFNILGNSYEIISSWDGTSGRKITIDGKLATSSSLVRLVRILWVTPLMDRIWIDGSAERRRFLDRIVSNLIPEHTEHCVKYYKAMKQRNKLIKEKIFDLSWFNVLESQMATFGVAIDKARKNVVADIMAMQKNSISAFPVADLNVIGLQHSSVEEFREALRKNREKDIYAGRTLIGPHLSDLAAVYFSKGTDVKLCSTGEQKALLISIIIATAKIQLEVYKAPPILLFDEISAHLDSERRSILYDELYNLNLQVFLTGTDITSFKELKSRAKYYQVLLNTNESKCRLVNDPHF